MDPSVVRELARRLALTAAALEREAHAMTVTVRGLRWRGGDADQFHRAWLSNGAPSLSKVAASLREQRELLVRQAVEQEHASAATESGPGSSATPPSAAERDAANRRRLDADIARLERDDPRGRELANARSIKQALSDSAYLLVYVPRGSDMDGRAVIAYNNPDRADNVAVMVPGTGADVQNMPTGNARKLLHAMDREDRHAKNSVVMYMGYDAPDNLASAALDKYAERGARQLQHDVAAMQESHAARNHGKDAHVTVVGHSYGSTVVGTAVAHEGLQVDDVVLVGSPGAGVDHARDLDGVDADHVWVGAAHDDPVGYLGRYGRDPASVGFGGHRFAAEHDGVINNPVGEHVGYYRGESLDNIANIAVGDYDDVDRALPRTVGPFGPPVDPEGLRDTAESTVGWAGDRIEDITDGIRGLGRRLV